MTNIQEERMYELFGREEGEMTDQEGQELSDLVDLMVYELDQEIAQIKLDSQGLKIDKLTSEQIRYANDYSAGT